MHQLCYPVSAIAYHQCNNNDPWWFSLNTASSPIRTVPLKQGNGWSGWRLRVCVCVARVCVCVCVCWAGWSIWGIPNSPTWKTGEVGYIYLESGKVGEGKKSVPRPFCTYLEEPLVTTPIFDRPSILRSDYGILTPQIRLQSINFVWPLWFPTPSVSLWWYTWVLG